MKADRRSPLSADWREIASLGEQIVSAPSLSIQRDIIVGVTSRLVRGDVQVWLRESLFRLPNIEEGNPFAEEPSLLAVRVDGKGDVTRTHVAWTVRRGAPLTPSPLLVEDTLYLVSDIGIASALDAKEDKSGLRRAWCETFRTSSASCPRLRAPSIKPCVARSSSASG